MRNLPTIRSTVQIRHVNVTQSPNVSLLPQQVDSILVPAAMSALGLSSVNTIDYALRVTMHGRAHSCRRYFAIKRAGMPIVVRAGSVNVIGRRVVDRQAQNDEAIGCFGPNDCLFVPTPIKGNGRIGIRIERDTERYPTGILEVYGLTVFG